MPHIGAVMERSLGEVRGTRQGLMDLLARSVVAGLGKRNTFTDLQGQITDAKTAFSSWDNCMKATFCKWPVIAVIIVGGLIILSIVWCIVRCACCGLSCCCECCYCLKCCGSCCGCCDAPKKTKYLDDPFVPPHHDQGQGYRPEAPMVARAIPNKPEPPQYAEFETVRKGTGDELPAMPSWEEANSKKVALEEEALELDQLQKPTSSPSAPLMAPGAMSHPPSPNLISPMRDNHSPYGAPDQNGPGAYMAVSRATTDPYVMNGHGQGYDNYGNEAYRQTSREDMNHGYDNNQGYNQGYGNQDYGAPGGMGAIGQGQGRRPPQQDYNNGDYGRGPMPQGYPQSRTPRPYDEFGRSGSPRIGNPRNGTPGNGGYGRPPPRLSPPQATDPYGNPDQRRSPAPQPRGYGYDQRSNTPNSYGRQYPAAPQRQYSSDSTRPLARQAPERQYSDTAYQESHSPIQNSLGFDFTSGYSRPETARSTPPPQQPGGGQAYPGYRPYKPQQ